nr:MAG TPA: hypothetical protein [Caudoviricetes sp.]
MDVSGGTDTGIDDSDSSVLKNGFGILKFAEAPNYLDPLGVAYRGVGLAGSGC